MAGNLEQLLAEIRSVYLPPGDPEPAVDDLRQISFLGVTDPPAVGPDDEEMIASVMRLLHSVAAAAERTSVLPRPPTIFHGVLSGPELIMRWECLAGRSGMVPGLLPGFTYLATVFFLDFELALRKSEEVRALVEAAGFKAK